jgi:hypothetical protein
MDAKNDDAERRAKRDTRKTDAKRVSKREAREDAKTAS